MYLCAQMELGAQIWTACRENHFLTIFHEKIFFGDRWGVLGREYQLGWEYESQNNEIIFKWPKEHFNDVKSLQGCEKWILRKILHRYSDSKKFSTFFFDRKKYFSKMKNIFWKWWKQNLVRIWNFSSIKIFYKHFFKNYFFSIEKKKLRKFSNHYIDVKFSEESIFRILGTIWQVLALQSLE